MHTLSLAISFELRSQVSFYFRYLSTTPPTPARLQRDSGHPVQTFTPPYTYKRASRAILLPCLHVATPVVILQSSIPPCFHICTTAIRLQRSSMPPCLHAYTPPYPHAYTCAYTSTCLHTSTPPCLGSTEVCYIQLSNTSQIPLAVYMVCMSNLLFIPTVFLPAISIARFASVSLMPIGSLHPFSKNSLSPA